MNQIRYIDLLKLATQMALSRKFRPQGTQTRLSKIALLILMACLSSLVGCSRSHGFEGQYTIEHNMDFKIDNFATDHEAVENVSVFASDIIDYNSGTTLTLGRDFAMIDGEKIAYDKIYVRNPGHTQYLVFERGDDKMLMRISLNGQQLERVSSGGLLNLYKVNAGDEFPAATALAQQ